MSENMEQQSEYNSSEIQIDLRPYIRAIFNKFWLIVTCVILTLALLFLYSFLQPKSYTASSDISMLNLKSKISFGGDQLQIIEEEQDDKLTIDNRPKAMLSLADSSSVKTGVTNLLFQELLDEELITEEDSIPLAFEVVQEGDLMQLSVSHNDPEIAARASNIWAKEFVRTANRAFVDTGSDPEESRFVADEAYQDYLAARSDLREFVLQDPFDELSTELAYVKDLLQGLRQQRSAVFLLSNNAPIQLANRLLATTQNIVEDQVDNTLQKELRELPRDYNYWYSRKELLESAKLELESLQLQYDAGMREQGDVVGEALSDVIDNARLTELSQGGTLELDINSVFRQANRETDLSLGETKPLTDLFPAIKESDVNTALSAVEEELALAETETARLAKELLLSSNISDVPLELSADNQLYDLLDIRVQEIMNRPILLDPRDPEFQNSALNQSIDSYMQYQRELDAEVLVLKSERELLVRDHDSTLQLYQTLDIQAREVAAQFVTGSPQVRVASPAYAPINSDSITVLAYPIAVFLGGTLGLMLALIPVIREQAFKED